MKESPSVYRDFLMGLEIPPDFEAIPPPQIKRKTWDNLSPMAKFLIGEIKEDEL